MPADRFGVALNVGDLHLVFYMVHCDAVMPGFQH